MKVIFKVLSIAYFGLSLAIVCFSLWLGIRYYNELIHGHLSPCESLSLPPAILGLALTSVFPILKCVSLWQK